MIGACNTSGGEDKRLQNFRWKPEGKRQFGRPKRRWENNIQMDLKEVGCVGMDWTELAQDRDL